VQRLRRNGAQGPDSATAYPTCGGSSEALRPITFHALRHFGATPPADRVRLVVLKVRLGHASVTTTANIYVHRSRSMAAVAIEQLQQLFSGARKTQKAGRRCDARKQTLQRK
jgi:integrase